MFLSVRRIRNQRYLYLLETVPGKKQGTHTNRIVKNLGNFDKLPEEVRNAYLDKKAKQALAKRLRTSTSRKRHQLGSQLSCQNRCGTCSEKQFQSTLSSELRSSGTQAALGERSGTEI